MRTRAELDETARVLHDRISRGDELDPAAEALRLRESGHSVVETAVILSALGILTAGVGGFALGGGKAVVGGTIRAGGRSAATTATKGAGKLCSFAGSTPVLVADGSKKPIEDIEVGDEVIATDPETGEQAARKVTHVWVHQDDLFEFEVDGKLIVTTEDHPFWSVTDQAWQGTQEFDRGERVLTADGSVLAVTREVDPVHRKAGTAYNLTVAGLHTYHVGESDVLVHNAASCSPLKVLHGDDTLSRGSLDYWKRQDTDAIVRSLAPDSEVPLTVKPDGTIMDGNTRVRALQLRDYDINSLPRTPYGQAKPMDDDDFWSIPQ